MIRRNTWVCPETPVLNAAVWPETMLLNTGVAASLSEGDSGQMVIQGYGQGQVQVEVQVEV
jgi:hypothetical protein